MKRFALAGSLLVGIPLFITTTAASQQSPVVRTAGSSVIYPKVLVTKLRHKITASDPMPPLPFMLPKATPAAVHHAPPPPVHKTAPPPPQPVYQTAVASWYDLGGTGSCGASAQSGYQFASLFLPCGARVEFCYATCVVGTMDDHGPYVYGRLFDLNVNLRSALGCSDLCDVRWRRVG